MVKLRRDKTPEVRRVAQELSAFERFDADTPEDRLNARIGIYGYNVIVKSGNLKGGIGVDMPTYNVGSESITLPSLVPFQDVIASLNHFRTTVDGVGKDMILAHSVDGKFYLTSLLEDDGFSLLEGVPVVRKATPVNYFKDGADHLLIYHENGLTDYDGTSVSNFESVPPLTSVTMLYERAFGVEERSDKVHFSAISNPTDFSVESGGGWITLRDDGGALTKIVSFGSSLYVFKEYGVYRLSVLGSPEDYSVERVLHTHSKIVPATIETTPHGIIFLMGTALYIFDGYTVRTLDRGLIALMESDEYAVGEYFDDRYYLACKMKTEGELVGDERDLGIKKNNAVFHFNVVSGAQGILRGADIVGFFPVLTKGVKEIFVVFGNVRSHRPGRLSTDGKMFGEPLEKRWRSARTKMGAFDELKNLKRITLDTSCDLKIKVYQGSVNVEKTAYASSTTAVVPFGTVGYDFAFEISCTGDLFVRNAKLIFDYVRKYCP